MMNLLANKELISLPYLALDCGFVVSWVSFLCQDMICKRFGAKASIKISIPRAAGQPGRESVLLGMLAHARHGGAYYDTGMIEVNTALNATIGGTWYVVLGLLRLAMLVSAVVNSTLNQSLGRMLKKNNFCELCLSLLCVHGHWPVYRQLGLCHCGEPHVFGWTWVQVLMCSLTGAVAELLCEVFLSPVG